MTKKSNRYDDRRAWYAIHTYAGYEEAGSRPIRQRIEGVDRLTKSIMCWSLRKRWLLLKTAQRKIVEQKIFQGYVLVEMKLTEDTWFIIRNTPGVTGCVALAPPPTPVSDKEIAEIKQRMGVDEPKHDMICRLAKLSTLLTVHLRDFEGSVSEIDPVKGKIKVLVSMFGRDTLSWTRRPAGQKDLVCTAVTRYIYGA